MPRSPRKTVKAKAPRKRTALTVNAKFPEWSDAHYWSFIRSGLRAKWNRYPVKWALLREASRAAHITAKGRKFEYQCAKCLGWHPAKLVTVDHIVPCGTLKAYSDLPVFVERLFCSKADLQVLCIPCHALKTKAERAMLAPSTTPTTVPKEKPRGKKTRIRQPEGPCSQG